MAGDWLRWTRNDRELGRRSGEKVSVLSLIPHEPWLPWLRPEGRRFWISIAKDIGSTRMLQRSMRHKVKNRLDRVVVHLDTKVRESDRKRELLRCDKQG